jgi:hypothetical protein
MGAGGFEGAVFLELLRSTVSCNAIFYIFSRVGMLFFRRKPADREPKGFPTDEATRSYRCNLGI